MNFPLFYLLLIWHILLRQTILYFLSKKNRKDRALVRISWQIKNIILNILPESYALRQHLIPTHSQQLNINEPDFTFTYEPLQLVWKEYSIWSLQSNHISSKNRIDTSIGFSLYHSNSRTSILYIYITNLLSYFFSFILFHNNEITSNTHNLVNFCSIKII